MILVALRVKAHWNVNSHCWLDFVSFESYNLSALKVDKILVFLKATVGRNINSHCSQDFGGSETYSRQECVISLCWQDFGSSESYDHRVKKVVDPLEKEMLNVEDPRSYSDGSSLEGK